MVEFKPNGDVHSSAARNGKVWKKWVLQGNKIYVDPVYFDLPVKNEMLGNNPKLGNTVRIVKVQD
jgi:hypothetical protein